MPDAYEIAEGRYIQEYSTESAANALSVASTAVPSGKVWTILQARVQASVAETQDYWFSVRSRSTQRYPVTWPRELAGDPALYKYAPMLTEGMELRLYPGDILYAYRDAATAGSTMSIYLRYIETDLPLYDYVEPQEKLRIQKFRRSLVPGAVSPIGGGRPAGIGGGGGPAGGGGGIPRPK